MKVAKHPRFNKPYTELIYQPIFELIEYLKNNQYKIYIVSGGGQDFIRTYSSIVYGIPSEQVHWFSRKTRYEYKNARPILMKLSEILLVDNNSGKPETIHLFKEKSYIGCR